MIGKTPDVIASNSSAAMRALTRETRTIPIVTMNVTDLVRRYSEPGSAGWKHNWVHQL